MAAIDHQQNQFGSKELEPDDYAFIENKAKELFAKACKEVHGDICEGLQIDEFNFSCSLGGRVTCSAPNVRILCEEQPDGPEDPILYELKYKQIDQDMKVLEWLRTDDKFNRYFTDLRIGGVIKRIRFTAKGGPFI